MTDAARTELPAPHVLRDYAFLADGERGVLIGPRGDISWMCFPRWHDPGLFSELIGGRGTYQITPVDRYVWGGYYEQGTLIWHSRWVTTAAIVECREALAYPGGAEQAILLRRITAVQGTAAMRITLSPAAEFGEEPFQRLRRDDHGTWRGKTGDVSVRWHGGESASPHPDGHRGRVLIQELSLEPGESHDFVLTLNSPQDAPDLPGDAEHLWQETAAAWAATTPPFDAGTVERDARQSYAVLRGMTSDASGAMVAAATTSLPERASEGRNYDYRYAWIRDQCYAGQAVAAHGADGLLDCAVRFVAGRLLADGPNTTPAYTVTGGQVPGERRLSLPGYPGGYNVVGNRVNQQFQLDAFSEPLLLFAAAAKLDRLDSDAWRAAELAANAIADRWRNPDAGIWELAPAHWSHSALNCVAGLRQISHYAPTPRQASRWVQLADQIVASTAKTGMHRSGRWQRTADDLRVDASLLLPAIRGAIPADDPRSLATLGAVKSELAEAGHAYRFRHDERPLGEAEGAFLICGFWLSLAHRQLGDAAVSAQWFERTRAACGPPGLYSEEYDVAQRQLRGNIPQAFVHALLLECAAGRPG